MKYEDYQKFKRLCIDEVNINSLINIEHLDLKLPYKQKVEQYIKDDITPYIFTSHDLKVETIYNDTNGTIDDLLITYFSNLK